MRSVPDLDAGHQGADLSRLRIHDLRHTAVGLWIAAGANPKQIATWAGHTSVAIVLDRYGHLLEGNDSDVLDDQLADGPTSVDEWSGPE